MRDLERAEDNRLAAALRRLDPDSLAPPPSRPVIGGQRLPASLSRSLPCQLALGLLHSRATVLGTRGRTRLERYAFTNFPVRRAIARLTRADAESAAHANAVDFSASD